MPGVCSSVLAPRELETYGPMGPFYNVPEGSFGLADATALRSPPQPCLLHTRLHGTSQARGTYARNDLHFFENSTMGVGWR